MRRLPLLVLPLFALSMLAAPGIGQDKDKKKDPTPKKDLPGPFHPYNVTGPFGERANPDPKKKDELKGQYHCPVSDTNLDPGVLVFIKDVDFDAAQLDLLQKLNTAGEKNPNARLHVTAVFFSPELPEVIGNKDKNDDTREQMAAKLRAKATDLKLNHVVLTLAGLDDIKEYVKDDAPVTLVGYHKFR